jgi:proteasome lid subunit RPN8/RPN11
VEAIEAHAAETYPEECCGFLIGTPETPARVASVRRARNIAETNRERRYVIDPLEQLSVEKALDMTREAILGFYHSHPNHPAEPSEFDRTHAVPWYTWYVILSIVDRKPASLRAWSFDGAASAFRPETLTVDEP